MQLKRTSQEILNQLSDLTDRLSDTQFTVPLEILNGNTIGKHIRHIIEFFDILEIGVKSGVINYDNRKHETLFETNPNAVKIRLRHLKSMIDLISVEQSVNLELSYSADADEKIKIQSSIARELVYNIEHAIHHMAIIKIAIQTAFPEIKLVGNFGVAYSTVRYQGSINE